LGEELGGIAPILLGFCDPTAADAEMADGDGGYRSSDDEDEDGGAGGRGGMDELRESCFAGFESFILHCPEEIKPYLPQIIASILAFIKYDPNYSYDDDDADDGAATDDPDEDDEDGFSDDGFEDDDDDDTSFLVRRGALRALSALVRCGPPSLDELWDTYGVGSALLSRFKEREDNVRVDAILCFEALLKRTVEAEVDEDDTMTDDAGPAGRLDGALPAAVKRATKCLADKRAGERTHSAALLVLRTAAGAHKSDEWVGGALPPVVGVLRSGAKAVKLDAVGLCRVLLEKGGDGVAAHLDTLLPLLCDAVGEDWYKIIAEALRALSAVPALAVTSRVSDPVAAAAALHLAITPRLEAKDIDQEIKECALQAAGELLCALHGQLAPASRDGLLRLLLDRLRNEITRLRALQTLGRVAAAEPKVDMGAVLGEYSLEAAALLRQQSQNLRLVSLEVLDVLVRCHGEGIEAAVIGKILKECGAVMVDSDLHISHLALRVAISTLVLQSLPTEVPNAMQSNILPKALALSGSPLLQGATLTSLLFFFQSYVSVNSSAFHQLLPLLRDCFPVGAGASISKVVVSNIAKCIAAIAAATAPEARNTFVLEQIKAVQRSDNHVGIECQLALLTLGELGQLVDLFLISPNIQGTIMACLDSRNEENKGAAAYALGRAAAGNVGVSLPVILAALQVEDGHHYLILTSLKEMLSSEKVCQSYASDQLGTVLTPLFKFAAVDEEGIRTMCAECLGALACLGSDGNDVLVFMKEQMELHSGKHEAEDIRICWTIANAMKFIITSGKVLDKVAEVMPSFLGLLTEQNLNLRAAALQMVYAAVHHSPVIISSLMKTLVLPTLYELVEFKSIRTVDLGPFKHKIDDGLPLRKTALSIFATALENCPSSLDIPDFMLKLAFALGDVEDIQLQAHQIVCSMCGRHSAAIVPAVASFVAPLKKTVEKQVKDNAADGDRTKEWVKSGLRATLALSRVEGIMECPSFASFFEAVKINVNLINTISQLKEERT